MRNVSLDEQRHIGFGVKMLADLIREDPECKDSVGELLREVSPYTTGVLVPPGWDRRYTECFGSTLEEIYEEGAISYQSKMRAVGLPLRDIPGSPSPTTCRRGRSPRPGSSCSARASWARRTARRRATPRRCSSCSTRSAAPPTRAGSPVSA